MEKVGDSRSLFKNKYVKSHDLIEKILSNISINLLDRQYAYTFVFLDCQHVLPNTKHAVKHSDNKNIAGRLHESTSHSY